MDSQTKKKLTVDPDVCVGCGMCALIAPQTFIIKDGKSTVVVEPADSVEKIKEAIESCPVEAISEE